MTTKNTTEQTTILLDSLLSDEHYEKYEELINKRYNINPDHPKSSRLIHFQINYTTPVSVTTPKSHNYNSTNNEFVAEIELNRFRNLVKFYGKDKAIKMITKAFNQELKDLTWF